MTLDFERHLGAVERSVAVVTRDDKEARAVILTRRYATDIQDLWDAITNPERLPRWFLPVEGDLKPGGHYQLKGNAGGRIDLCEPPQRLDLTWEFGDHPPSWVEVRLSADESDQSQLELRHIAHPDQFWDEYGPGAGGIGWELGLVGLSFHLDDPETAFDEAGISSSPEGKALIAASSKAWAEADIAAGAAADAALAAGRRTHEFYTGESSGDA